MEHHIESQSVPLRGGPIYGKCAAADWKKRNSLQGPKRAIRLCLLGLILPGLLISVPLYLKHRVYDYQVYPVGLSDMRLIDNRVSTTWCQRQLVKSNATFNAFLMSGAPHVALQQTHVSMTRNLVLSDDMKEYWGFYLLKGSTVTLSTCARWPGASLILIRGHRHLHECAYIGDDSSEELEELLEIVAEGGTIQIPEDPETPDEGPSNRVDLLTKHRPEVTFHDPRFDPKLKENAQKYVFHTKESETEEEINTKQMKMLLSELSYKANRAQVSRDNLPEAEKEERYQNLKNELMQHRRKQHPHLKRVPAFGANENDLIRFEDAQNNGTGSSSRKVSSKELMEGVLIKLKQLGTKGERVLELLQQVDKSKLLTNDSVAKDPTQSDNATTSDSVAATDNLNSSDTTAESDNTTTDAIAKTISSATAPTKSGMKKNRSDEISDDNLTRDERLLRQKRDIILKTLLTEDLNAEEEEKDNLGIEEGYVPDGIADHHQVLNQSTLNDRSNSEFWSSFSSSEEALINCAGLILSLPLTPHRSCKSQSTDGDFEEASFANKITYTVPKNGYYFFVFNSENEVQENYIRVHFNIKKTVYDVSNPVTKCSNTTDQCDLPLDFFSNEKVVFELPVNANESRWNEEFLVVSECEPRTAVYLVCVLSVPLLILFFAFQ